MVEGPNCFQLANYDNLLDNEYLNQMIQKLKLSNIDVSIEALSSTLKRELHKFKEKYKASLSEVYKFNPKIMMNLLLNFESFDETTKVRDVYMPEEKIINFNVGYLKINFKGKLRLTADRESKKIVHKNPNVLDGFPGNTYGVVEERDLIIKFDKPVIIKHVFVRAHQIDKTGKNNMSQMNFEGYRKDALVYSTKMRFSYMDKEWTKITPTQTVVDSIKFPKDFDIDDLHISHDSDYADNEENNGQITSILQTVIDELIEQSNNKKNIKDEDI